MLDHVLDGWRWFVMRRVKECAEWTRNDESPWLRGYISRKCVFVQFLEYPRPSALGLLLYAMTTPKISYTSIITPLFAPEALPKPKALVARASAQE